MFVDLFVDKIHTENQVNFSTSCPSTSVTAKIYDLEAYRIKREQKFQDAYKTIDETAAIMVKFHQALQSLKERSND